MRRILGLILGLMALPVMAVGYDGLWFMGLNLHKDIFNNLKVRKAINYAVNREYIATRIMSEEAAPNGVIPPGMTGYDKKSEDYGYSPAKARALLKGIRVTNLVLLHTDGIKTIKIAETIKKNLGAVGIKVTLKQVPYSEQDLWERELESGRHHLFLMGYKIDAVDNIYIGDRISRLFHVPGCEKIPDPDNQVIFGSYEEATSADYTPDSLCHPRPEQKKDTDELLNPLFHSKGSANFTYFSSRRVDALLDQIMETDPAMKSLRIGKFKEINRILHEAAPTVNLFYITKL